MKRLFAILLSAVMLLSLYCCTGTAEDTTAADTEMESAAASTETEPEMTETEPEETYPEETVTPSEATLAEGFSILPVPQRTKTENNTTKAFKAGGTLYFMEYESTFYGAESMIDRDSHHMGDLYVSAKYCVEYPVDEGYVYGEFNGDRYSEYLCFTDGVLYIYKGDGRKKPKYNNNTLLYTQKLDGDLTLCGTGDYNGDGMTDILFVGRYRTAFIGYSNENGFDFVSAGRLECGVKYESADFYSGDMNGDGLCDIIAVKDLDTCSWLVKENKAELYAEKRLNIEDSYECCCIADVNTDYICDLIVYLGNKRIRTYFGRIDGQFGPYEDEVGNENLYPTWDGDVTVKYMTPGDTNEDGVSDIIGTMTKRNSTEYNLVSLTYPTEAPAYDYSTHIIKKDDGTYILYNGGLYVDYDKDKYNPTDGDHVLVYTSEDGVRWHRNLDAPAFYLGGELGINGEWWCGNTIEPEVVYVDGTYYMYWQCENYTHLEDGTLIGHDKIGLATSKDGLHFERKTDTPVIINEPEYTSFDHEMLMYVEDDPDGLPFWLYVRRVIRNKLVKLIRLRSADPACYDFDTAEEVSGLSQIGNQMGWCRLDDGSRLYTHITFVQVGDGTVPALQFSKDGINWSAADVVLAGPDHADPLAANNPNIYFLGFSTINGTGEIERLPDGRYRFIYGGCTSKTPVAPHIFYSSVGRGECVFSLTVK